MKTPLVLLPGLLSDERLWKYSLQHLEDIAEMHVICSEQPTPRQMIENIMAKAPPKFVLAGHSMGGWLALEIMRHVPERVLRLALLNTTACPDTQEKKSKRLEMIEQAEKGEFPQVARDLVSIFAHRQEAKKEIEEMFLHLGKEIFICQEKAMLARDETLSILPTISCPTLVIHSEHDQIFTLEDHEELASSIEGAKLAIVAGAGHMSPMEAPEAISDLLRGLAI